MTPPSSLRGRSPLPPALAAEIASARLLLALARFSLELKYDPGQPRVPKGQRAGGQWLGSTHEGRLNLESEPGSPSAMSRITRAALANPEAAAVGAAAAAPLAVGAMGVSRAAGLAAHYANGVPVTPILGLPGDAEDLTPPAYRLYRNLTPEEQKDRDEACEDLYRQDLKKCSQYARDNANKSGYTKKAIYAICSTDAFNRRNQCRKLGEDHVTQYLFTGGED